jgi:membrane protein implicated in regulation of membrane protease activity
MPKNLPSPSLTIEMAMVCFLIFVNLWLLYRLVNKKTAIQTQRAEQEAQRAEREARKAERLAAKLRELNIDPDTI